MFSIFSSTAYAYEQGWEKEQTSSDSGVLIPEDEFISFLIQMECLLSSVM